MAKQVEIKGAVVKGEFRGFYEVPGKEGKVHLYGQLLQEGNDGKETLVEFRAKNETMFNTMKKGEQVEVVLDIREMDYQGRKYMVVDAA